MNDFFSTVKDLPIYTPPPRMPGFYLRLVPGGQWMIFEINQFQNEIFVLDAPSMEEALRRFTQHRYCPVEFLLAPSRF